MKEKIRQRLITCGASSVGFTRAGEISREVDEKFAGWIGEGCNAGMDYLSRHRGLRFSTESVLPESKTVICLTFGYHPSEWRDPKLPYIASYAYGDDYHLVLREVLTPVVKDFKQEYGGKWRICIDSAPVAERYWACKSGVGYTGRNGAVISQKSGSLCFLVEILATIEIPEDTPLMKKCEECGKCVEVCPGKALRPDGTIDSGKCINYLTIEKKGDFSQEEIQILKSGQGFLFGCDLCLRVCPHNHAKVMENRETLFPISPAVKTLTPDLILKLQESEFNALFSRSPLLYAGYSKLIRNSLALKK